MTNPKGKKRETDRDRAMRDLDGVRKEAIENREAEKQAQRSKASRRKKSG